MAAVSDVVMRDAAVWEVGPASPWTEESRDPRWGVGSSVTFDDRPGAAWQYLPLPGPVQELVAQGADVRLDLFVGGAAIAAGVTVGRRRFAVPMDRRARPVHVSLEIGDRGARVGCCVEGRVTEAWSSPADERDVAGEGVVSLAVFGGAQVEFTGLRAHVLDAPCDVSVVITCHKFAQRLRVALRSWAGQDAPAGSFEVLLVTPGNPDGAAEQFAAFAVSHPRVRLRHLALDGPPNKGWLLNEATRVARGKVLWFTDADCVYPRDAVSRVREHQEQILSGRDVYYVERRHLGRVLTDAALCHELDLLADFDRVRPLADERPPQSFPWGYAQIMATSVARELPFRQDLESFAHHDGVFLEDAARSGSAFHELDGVSCLHLSHPFSWYGAEHFL